MQKTEKALTKERVKEVFCSSNLHHTLVVARGIEESVWTEEQAKDEAIDAAQRVEEALKEAGRSFEELNEVERLLWLTKEIYLSGFLEGMAIVLKANNMAADLLFTGA